MQLNIGTRQYRTKPKQFASINNDVIGNIVDLSLEEIIDRVGNKGYTFTRAIMRGARTKENFIKQRFLVLDFDEGMSEEKFKRRCTELRLSYVFMYRTLSWSKTEERFRAVFLMENWIENSQVAYIINDMLYRIFPESDKSCRDITKLFLGGKKVVDINLEARINVAELAKAVHSYYKLTKPSNYVRDLEKIATDWGIKTVDGWFCIYDVKDFKQEELDKIDNKIIDNDVLVILADKEKLKYNSTINEIVKTVKTRKLPNLQVLTSYNTESLCKLCPLLREFVEGTDIHHDLKWKLALSLQYIKGGKSLFMNSLIDSEEKWKIAWSDNIPDKYPERCAYGKYPCPHSSTCNCYSLYAKASKKIRILESQEDFYDLEDCQKELKEYLQKGVSAANSEIYIIKAQTALGKTQQYIEIIKNNPNKKFIIAAPTIKLQLEIAARLMLEGVCCEITESMYAKAKQLNNPELTRLLDRAIAGGFERRMKKIIAKYKADHCEELSTRELEMFDWVLKKQGIGQSGAQCIVTTHELFILKELYKLDGYEKIIDEDILMTLFRQMYKLPLDTLKKLLSDYWLPDKDRKTIKEILSLKDMNTMEVHFQNLSESTLDYMYQNREKLKGPAPKLFESTHVVMCKASNEIVFSKKLDFAESGKLIVLSATANRALYIDYFSHKHVNFREVHKAKYKGKLIQYTAETLSREYLKKNGKEKVLEEICTYIYTDRHIKDIPIISFKLLFPNSDIHFGKTEGFNKYKGKDIAVIGTPHNSPVVYKLVGAMLGYQTAGRLNNWRVKRNCFDFMMMTYGDSQMQNLQLFFIESELEQAIGRARLLRENCTVYVFSNYPCQQAELVQEKYLKDNMETLDYVEGGSDTLEC